MNPYQVLGVARDADDAAIKKAYRRLAQESHPDRHPDDDSAEERFKEIGKAYGVLSDAERRSAYDQFGDIALDPNFDASRARAQGGFHGGFPGGGGGSREGAGGFADFGSLFEDLLGGPGRAPRARRGADLETRLDLDFVEAALGCEKRVSVHGESLDVRIPPGVADGGKIRLSGKGAPGTNGGPAGNLIAKIRVRPHKVFRREGRNIVLEVSVSVAEAVLGTHFEVPTLDGKVMLRVPPGTDSGSKLRLRGKGIPRSASGEAAGDLYVAIRIRVPKDLDEAGVASVKELEALGPQNLRDDLFDGDQPTGSPGSKDEAST